MTVQRSVVKWFDAKKGYGFIVNPTGGHDIFVHYTSIVTDRRFKTLRTGEVVDFELEDGPKGLHALDVKPIDTVADRDDDRDYEREGSAERGYDPDDRSDLYDTRRGFSAYEARPTHDRIYRDGV